MFDIISVIFWTITYALIIAAGIKGWQEKKISIPYLPVVLNISWEFCALIQSEGFYGHILWFGFDCAIVALNFSFLNNKKYKTIFTVSIVAAIYMQNCISKIDNGMLIMSFIMDLIMAICFCLAHQKISRDFKICIAITKMIGDVGAAIYYSAQSIFVAVSAAIVFICNLFYLSLCLNETEKRGRIKGRYK